MADDRFSFRHGGQGWSFRDDRRRFGMAAVLVLSLVFFGIYVFIYHLFFDDHGAPVPKPEQAAEVSRPPEAIPGRSDPPPEQAGPAAGQPTAGGQASVGSPAAGEVAESPEAAGLQVIDLSIEGSIAEGLIAALAGQPDGTHLAEVLTAHLRRIFMWTVDFQSDLRRGDRVRLVYGLDPSSTDGIKVHAAWLQSQKQGSELSGIWFKPEGWRFGKYFDQRGEMVGKLLKNPPIDDFDQVTDLQQRRPRKHDGVDFKGPVGTPVKSPWDARVVQLNWNQRYNGRCVKLQYEKSGLYGVFLHLDRIYDFVRPGSRIKAGTVFAELGNTGRSYAPHLHYGVQKGLDDGVLDPYKVHGGRVEPLPAADRARFEAEAVRLKRLVSEEES